MSQPSNVIAFPVNPRVRDRRRRPAVGSETNWPGGMRLQLKDIIDTAYDGLLNDREAESLVRISEMIIRSARSNEDRGT